MNEHEEEMIDQFKSWVSQVDGQNIDNHREFLAKVLDVYDEMFKELIGRSRFLTEWAERDVQDLESIIESHQDDLQSWVLDLEITDQYRKIVDAETDNMDWSGRNERIFHQFVETVQQNHPDKGVLKG